MYTTYVAVEIIKAWKNCALLFFFNKQQAAYIKQMQQLVSDADKLNLVIYKICAKILNCDRHVKEEEVNVPLLVYFYSLT